MSHISRGLKTANGPKVASGSTGSTTRASRTSCMTARSSRSPRRHDAVQLGLEVEQHRDGAAQHDRHRAIAEHGVGAEPVHQEEGDLGGDPGIRLLAQVGDVSHRRRHGHAEQARGQHPAPRGRG